MAHFCVIRFCTSHHDDGIKQTIDKFLPLSNHKTHQHCETLRLDSSMRVHSLYHQLPKRLSAFLVLVCYCVLSGSAFVLPPAVPLLGVQTIPTTARCRRPLTSTTTTDNPTLAGT